MKLIDRDKLIEELEKKKEIESNRCQYMAYLGLSEYVEKYNHGEYCYLESMRIANEQPTVNRWIPCEERFPEKSGNYIVTMKVTNKLNETYYDVIEATYWSSLKTWEDTVDDISVNVIAWQPLPKAYEE